MIDDLLIEIDLDTGTERLSLHGTRTEDGIYQALLEEPGDLVRELVPGGGLSPVDSFSFSIADASGDWRTKLEATPWRLRRVRVYSITAGVKRQEFSGLAAATSASPEAVTVDCRDDSLDRFTDPFTLQIFPDIFPDMPETTAVELVPIVLGSVSSSSFDVRGHIPAYLVDPKITAAAYRYVAAQHPLKSVTAVYRDGELVDPADYSIAYANVATAEHGSVRMTFIDFTRDPRAAGDDRDVSITYDATGMTDDNLETGTLITDPAEGLQALLTLRGLLSVSDFDATLTAAATAAYSAAGITLGAAVVDSGDTVADVLERFGESYCLQLFRTRAGKFGIRFDDASGGAAAEDVFDDRDASELDYRQQEAAVSTLQFLYAWDYSQNRPTARSAYSDAVEEALLGRTVREQAEWPYLRDVAQCKKIAQIKLFQRRSERHLTQVRVTPRDLELGDYVSLTHFAGPDSSGIGYAERVFQVVGMELTVDDGGLFQVLTLLDAPGLALGSPSDTEPGRTSQDLPPPGSQIFSDVLWTPADNNTVNWGGHSIKIVGGGKAVLYTGVAAGNTGNMTAATPYYVYFDPLVNSAALQLTTSFQTATSPGRWLMAVCQAAPDTADDALVDNRVGFSSVGVTTILRRVGGDQIPDDSIDNRHLRVDSVTADNINVVSLYALSAVVGGELTGGTLTGTVVRTAATGQRIQLTSSAFEAYDASGYLAVKIPSSNDRINFYQLGALRGALFGSGIDEMTLQGPAISSDFSFKVKDTSTGDTIEFIPHLLSGVASQIATSMSMRLSTGGTKIEMALGSLIPATFRSSPAAGDGNTYLKAQATGVAALELDTPGGQTAALLHQKHNGATGASTLLTSGAAYHKLHSRDFGNDIPGPQSIVGRNSNGTNPGAGAVVVTDKNGTDHYLWPDASGVWRTSTSAPKGSTDTSGTVVGTQT